MNRRIWSLALAVVLGTGCGVFHGGQIQPPTPAQVRTACLLTCSALDIVGKSEEANKCRLTCDVATPQSCSACDDLGVNPSPGTIRQCRCEHGCDVCTVQPNQKCFDDQPGGPCTGCTEPAPCPSGTFGHRYGLNPCSFSCEKDQQTATPSPAPRIETPTPIASLPVPTAITREDPTRTVPGELPSAYAVTLEAVQRGYAAAHPDFFDHDILVRCDAVTQLDYLSALVYGIRAKGLDAIVDGGGDIAIAAVGVQGEKGSYSEQFHPIVSGDCVTKKRTVQYGEKAYLERDYPKWFTSDLKAVPVVEYDSACPCLNRVDVHIHGWPQNPMSNTVSGTGDGFYCIHMDTTARFGTDQCGAGGCIGKPDDRDHPNFGNVCEFQSKPQIIILSGQVEPEYLPNGQPNPATGIRFDPPDPLPYTFRLCGPSNTPIKIKALPPTPYKDKNGKAVRVCGVQDAPDGGTVFEGAF